MSNYPDILAKLGLRSLLALPPIGYAIYLAFRGDEFDFIVAILLVLIGGVILAPSITRLIAEPAGNVFFPGETVDEPPPMYSVVEAKVKKGLYEEAIQGYVQIAEKYPDELKPYLDMIEIAIIHMHDAGRAEAIFLNATSKLKSQEQLRVLTMMYESIKERLEPTPQWFKDEQKKELKLKERPKGEYPTRSSINFPE